MSFRPDDTIVFLFTDLEGSTRLWEQFPDAMKVALGRHDAILRGAVEAAGGQVVKTTGDGMMAVFGGAPEAVTAALAAQRDLGREPWAETGPLRVRIGVHVGHAEQRAGDFFGPTVNRTARIMAAGHGGQVLLSASAATLAQDRLPDGAGLLDLGDHRLKDLGRPERVFQLVHPDLAAGFPPLAAVRPSLTNLPAMAGELLGRDAELRRIRDRLAAPSTRLLTLTGPGGAGKTVLAVRAAEDLAPGFTDGASFVDLSNARTTDAVVVAIARAVGLDEVVDRPVLDELLGRLQDRRMLLVLDNFEQVTDAVGVVAQLLRDCPGLTVLATSREALRVRAEQVFPVPPLGLPPAGRARVSARQVEAYDAVRLFASRARAVRPDFEITDANAAAVAEICRRLDGLPLAIELAAARLSLLTPEALRDRLGDRLGLLRSGPRDLPERHQTLRATIDWSYELLAPGEQRLFELLAVFADAEIPAVEAVAAAAGEAVDVYEALAGLVAKSLVRQVDRPGSEPRVAMLETIREFAADRLAQRPDLSASARGAHAAHFAGVARSLRSDLTGNRRETALAALVAELANLRIAWDHWVAADDLEQLDKLADSLLIVYDARGWYLDTVGLTTDMLAVVGESSPSAARAGQEIALRTTLARALIATKGFTEEAERALVGALELFERGGDVRQQFSVLRGLASLYQFRAQFDQGGRLAQEILSLGERENDPQIQIDGHLLVGTKMVFLDDLPGGLDHLDRAIALFSSGPAWAGSGRVANDPRVACFTTSALALWQMGFPDRAVERMASALALAATLDHPLTSAYARFHSGLLHLWRREPQLALERAVGLLEGADEYDLGIWTAVGSCLLGAAQVGLGRIEEGLANTRSGMALYQERRSPPVFWPMLLLLEAGSLGAAGLPADGLRRLDPAIEIMSAGVGSTILPEFQLLKGDLLAAVADDDAGGHAAAEAWYRLAFEGAGRLGARMSQLRAATRLARRSRAAGDPETARAVLGPVYATFGEGFSSADLLDAGGLLAAVAPGGSAAR